MKTQAIKLIAMRPFLHGYNVLSVGDGLVTTPGHAKQLVLLGHARLDQAPEPLVAVDVVHSGAPGDDAAGAGSADKSDAGGASLVDPAGAAGGEGAVAETQAQDGAGAQGVDLLGAAAPVQDATAAMAGGAAAAGQPDAGTQSDDLLGGLGAGGDAVTAAQGAAGGDGADDKAATRQRRRAS